MNRIRLIAYLTIVCLLCCGALGCKPKTEAPNTTTTASEVATTTQSVTTTTVESADAVTTTTESAVATTTESEEITTTEKLITTQAVTTAKTTVTTTTVIATTTTTKKAPTTTTKAPTTTTKVLTTTTTKAPTTTTTAPKVYTPLTPVSPQDYYGYTLLKKTNNATLVKTYDCIVSAVEAMQTEIDFEMQACSPTLEELQTVWTYYRLDYPQHFWLARGTDGGYRCSYNQETGQVMKMMITYAMSASERTTTQSAVDKAADAILKKVSGSDTPYERELIIHDAICDAIVYDINAKRGHDLDGALLEGKAVCEGYAHALQYLLYRAGVMCGAVLGQKTTGENHKWNFVIIDGKAYHIDSTWNDVKKPNNEILSSVGHLYSYFNVSDTLIQREHRIFENESYPLPKCTSLDENYYKKNGTYLTSRSTDELIPLLKKGNGMVEVYIGDGNTDGYYEWFKSNHTVFAQALGLQAYNYGYFRVGEGMVLYIK